MGAAPWAEDKHQRLQEEAVQRYLRIVAGLKARLMEPPCGQV
jgi:hypothetical protein